MTMALTLFQEKWRNSLIAKDTPLCARFNEPLLSDTARERPHVALANWVPHYVDAMKCHAMAILTVPASWGNEGLAHALMDLHSRAAEEGVLSIEDMSGYGSKGLRAVTYSHLRGAAALVVSPACTLLENTILSAHEARMGLFVTCLDARLENMNEKDRLVPLPEKHACYVFNEDKHQHDGQIWVKKHVWLAEMAYRLGADGIACCAPDDHVEEDNLKRVARYAGQDMLVLCTDDGPALKTVYKYFNRNRVIVATDKLQSHDHAGHAENNVRVLKNINTARYAKKGSAASEDNAHAAR